MRIGLTLVAIFCLLGPGRAVAHPHVWIDALTFLGVKDGRLETVRVQWAFDEFFSSVLFTDFDKDGDGTFNDEEIAVLRAGAFAGLSEVGFFTDLRVDGERVAWDGFRNFGVAVSETGIVAYSFSLDLPNPVDLKESNVSLSLYDPDYYVDVIPIEDDPYRFRGLEGMTCSHSMEEATDTPIYQGLVFPQRAVFDCKAVSG